MINIYSSITHFPMKGLNWILPKNPVTGRREFYTTFEFIEKIKGSWNRENFIDEYDGYALEPEYQQKVDKVVARLRDLTKTSSGALLPGPKDVIARKALHWEFIVVNQSTLNARATLGGKVYINKGLIARLLHEKEDFGCKDITEEDKIAAVLCHEIIHIDACHHTKVHPFDLLVKGVYLFVIFVFFMALDKVLDKFVKHIYDLLDKHNVEVFRDLSDYFKDQLKIMNDGDQISIKKILFNIMLVKSAELLVKILATSFVVFQISCEKISDVIKSKSNEMEADEYGMRYMDKAKFNPEGAIWFLSYCKKYHEQTTGYSFLDNFYNSIDGSHPTHQQRLCFAEQNLASINAQKRKTVSVG